MKISHEWQSHILGQISQKCEIFIKIWDVNKFVLKISQKCDIFTAIFTLNLYCCWFQKPTFKNWSNWVNNRLNVVVYVHVVDDPWNKPLNFGSNCVSYCWDIRNCHSFMTFEYLPRQLWQKIIKTHIFRGGKELKIRVISINF